MGKSPNAFRTISEVADWLDTQAHVLRFWESKFSQVKPVKRAGGRRYYRPADMMLLGGIKKLLHDDGMTIKGAQKLLREKGIKYVSDLSQPIDDDDEDQTIEAQVAPETVEEQPPVEAGTILSFQQPERPAPDASPEDLDEIAGDLFAAVSREESTQEADEAVTASEPDTESLVAQVLEAEQPAETTAEAVIEVEAEAPEVEELVAEAEDPQTAEDPSLSVEVEEETEVATGTGESEDAPAEEDAVAAQGETETGADTAPQQAPADSFLPILAKTRSVPQKHQSEVAELLRRMQVLKTSIAEKENA